MGEGRRGVDGAKRSHLARRGRKDRRVGRTTRRRQAARRPGWGAVDEEAEGGPDERVARDGAVGGGYSAGASAEQPHPFWICAQKVAERTEGGRWERGWRVHGGRC